MFHKPSKKLVISLLLAIAFGSVIVGVCTPSPPPVVGADGTPTAGLQLGWNMILVLLGGLTGGSAGVVAFLKDNSDTIAKGGQQAIATIQQAIGRNKPSMESNELVQSVESYSLKTDDVSAQRRMILAVLTEAKTMSETQSPEISKVVADFGHAVMSKWFPAPDVAK